MGMMLIHIFDHKIKENGPYSVIVKLNPGKKNSYKIYRNKQLDNIESFRGKKKEKKNTLIQKIRKPSKIETFRNKKVKNPKNVYKNFYHEKKDKFLQQYHKKFLAINKLSNI